MSPFFSIAQINPGVGVLQGIGILFLFIALVVLFFLSAVACGIQTWRTSRNRSKSARWWFTATTISTVLFFSLIGGCFWMLSPKPLPHLEKHWDFTRSHDIEIIGEHGDQPTFTYSGNIALQILLPDQRSLSVQAQTLGVKCEQGRVKEIEVTIPKLKPVETVRTQGETILQNLNFTAEQVNQWRTSYPGFGWTTINGSTTEPKIKLEALYDEYFAETAVIVWIEWKN